MILFILAAFFAYKKAKSTGRSGILWALITAGVYIGTQFLFALGIGLFLAIGVELFGWSETIYDDFNLLITAVCIIASFGSVWLVFRYLDKIPEEETFISPPPPPTFDGK
jgi:FtsH-binding integral membrane protein